MPVQLAGPVKPACDRAVPGRAVSPPRTVPFWRRRRRPAHGRTIGRTRAKLRFHFFTSHGATMPLAPLLNPPLLPYVRRLPSPALLPLRATSRPPLTLVVRVL